MTEALLKYGERPRIWTGSTVGAACVTGLLALYFLTWFVVCLNRDQDWRALAFTGGSALSFAVVSAGHIRAWRRDRALRTAQSEYSRTASRHISKPVRSP